MDIKALKIKVGNVADFEYDGDMSFDFNGLIISRESSQCLDRLFNHDYSCSITEKLLLALATSNSKSSNS